LFPKTASSLMGQSYKKWMQGALAAGVAALAAGCAAPANTTTTATQTPANPTTTPAPQIQTSPQRPSAADKRFIIAPELLSVLHVVRVLLDNHPGTYLKIEVTVQNMTDAPQKFSYRIDWFDKEGERLPLGADNIPWTLLPREVSSVAATAPAPTAADFGIAFVPTVK
jgi:uncharacterized protein YcfL